MIFSRACQYAIQAVLYLATFPEDRFVSVREIAEKSDLSYHFMGKILQTLKRKGVLDSYKGPNGGVMIAKSKNKLTLLDIVEAIDGIDSYNQCIIGLPSCGDDQPCAVHSQWGRIREDIFRMLSETTISKLTE